MRVNTAKRENVNTPRFRSTRNVIEILMFWRNYLLWYFLIFFFLFLSIIDVEKCETDTCVGLSSGTAALFKNEENGNNCVVVNNYFIYGK